MDAFRRNDILFEQVLKSILSSPFVPSGTEPDVTNPDPRQFVNAKNITVNAVQNLLPNSKIPLIWFAKERITIAANILAKGAGSDDDGDFGGGGGAAGAGNNGKACTMPFSTISILAAVTGSNAGANLSTADSWKLSRALMFLPYLKGGAAGGNSGGNGGGVVCLCAPTIEIQGTAKIDASGGDASAGGNKGGGGGGLIVLIASRFVNVTNNVNVLVNGGTKTGTAGDGGSGVIIKKMIK